jgi:hypothetical protein
MRGIAARGPRRGAVLELLGPKLCRLKAPQLAFMGGDRFFYRPEDVKGSRRLIRVMAPVPSEYLDNYSF